MYIYMYTWVLLTLYTLLIHSAMEANMEIHYYQKFHHFMAMPFFKNFAPTLTQSQLHYWYYYYVTYASEAVVKSCSVKKAFLEILQNSLENACARVSFLKKRLWHRCFPVNFAKFLRTSFLIEHLRWLLLTFQSESTLYNFRTSSSKQAQYLKFKWTKTSWKYNRSDIVQTSFLCYVEAFRLLQWKCAPPKRFR